LKRFKFTNNGRRQKLDTVIDFQLEGLDMGEFILDKDPTDSTVYDCFAVSNHFGGLGGGHYTAFARNNVVWCGFDNSSVTEGVNVRA